MDGLIRGLTVTDFESRGLEGIALSSVRDATLTGVRIDEPRGLGTPNAFEFHAGIHCLNCTNAAFRDVAIAGGDTANLSYAVFVQDGANVTFVDAWASAKTLRTPIRIDGTQSTVPPNLLERFEISEGPGGVGLRNVRDWTLRDVHVVRVTECEEAAFVVEGSTNVTCTRCTVGDICPQALAAGGLTVVRNAEGVGAAPPLNLCF